MSREGCQAFAERIRTDAVLAREVAEKGRDRDALLAIARLHGYDVDWDDLAAFADEYAAREGSGSSPPGHRRRG